MTNLKMGHISKHDVFRGWSFLYLETWAWKYYKIWEGKNWKQKLMKIYSHKRNSGEPEKTEGQNIIDVGYICG